MDPNDRRALIRAFLPAESWSAWRIFLSATYGLPLTADEQAIFCRHTGRTSYDPPAGGWPEVVAVVGRQSGKTRVASLTAALEAVAAPAQPDRTEMYAVLVAQDQRAALRTLLAYARAPFAQVEVLRRRVTARRTESLTLENGVVIAAYPCRPEAVRGLRACVVVCDELAFYRSTEGFPTDVEMLRAVRPCLATTGGKLIVLSSPYGQTGALWELHRKYFGRDDAPVLVWQASAPEMNPTLPADYLARMEQDDPEAYRSEVLGEFRAGVSTFLDPEAIAACVADGVCERAPAAGVWYVGFVDPSGGRRDAFTLAIAHPDGERAVLDVLRAWPPPFNPAGVIAEACDLLRQYRVGCVTGDRYSGEFAAEQFRAHGVTYAAAAHDRSALYLELLPLINAERAVLLDVPDLLRELRQLQRRRGPSGRDRVDHLPGTHDDRANSAAGALVEALQGSRAAGVGHATRDGDPWNEEGPRGQRVQEVLAQLGETAAPAPSWLDLFQPDLAKQLRARRPDATHQRPLDALHDAQAIGPGAHRVVWSDDDEDGGGVLRDGDPFQFIR